MHETNSKGLVVVPTVYSGYIAYGNVGMRIHNAYTDDVFSIEANRPIKLTKKEAKGLMKALKGFINA